MVTCRASRATNTNCTGRSSAGALLCAAARIAGDALVPGTMGSVSSEWRNPRSAKSPMAMITDAASRCTGDTVNVRPSVSQRRTRVDLRAAAMGSSVCVRTRAMTRSTDAAATAGRFLSALSIRDQSAGVPIDSGDIINSTQKLHELRACALHSHLQGRYTRTGRLGDLLVRPVVRVLQEQRLAVLRLERHERALQIEIERGVGGIRRHRAIQLVNRH